MPKYVSMIRGINVAGHKPVKMAELRESYEGLSFKNVETYIQSGNVIFETPSTSLKSLVDKITKKISLDFRISVSVVIRTPGDLGRVVHTNPFLKKKALDSSRFHVTFLSETPKKSDISKMDRYRGSPDEFQILGKEVYVYCPNGYGRTKLSNNLFEKMLSVFATTRNWKTVNALYRFAGV